MFLDVRVVLFSVDVVVYFRVDHCIFVVKQKTAYDVRISDWSSDVCSSDLLMTFYVDDTRPLGTNNLVLPNASMPNVMWELQGLQVLKKASAAEGEEAAGHGEHEGPQFESATKGTLSPEEYKKWAADTTNFMEIGRAHV